MGLISWTAAKAIGGAYKVYSAVSDEIAKERRLRLTDGTGWSNFFGRSGAAGKVVNIHTAMQLSAFWACVRLTAQAVSVLPVTIYEKQKDGSREANNDHPLALIIEGSPNRDQTSLEYWESVVAWLCVNGNACSEIGRVGKKISSLDILPNAYPHRETDGTLVYKYTDRGQSYTLPRDKVFHVKGFGWGGDSGLSAVRYGVQTFSTAIATNETAGKMFSNGMQANGLLTSDQILKKDQREQLQEIMKTYAGSDNAGKLMILEAGLEYKSLTMSPVDAQMMEQQRFSVEEICRWLGVPPIIIGHAAQGQTMWGSGVEQIMIAWLTLGINPICERIERRITKQLIEPGEQKRVYAEFNREGLLQMDSTAKAAFLSSMTQNGLMSRNEGRSKLNLPKRDGADDLTAQSNLLPLDKLGDSSDAKQAQASMQAWLGIKDETKHEQARAS